MGQAHLAALKSDYKYGRRVGCIIVSLQGEKISESCNHRLKSLGEPAPDTSAEQHFLETQHAEEAALHQLSNNAWQACKGATAYVTLCPCAKCLRNLMSAGIDHIVTYKPDFNDPKWGEGYRYGMQMMARAGMTVTYMPRPKILHSVLKKLRMAA